jgi:hypothetical protein
VRVAGGSNVASKALAAEFDAAAAACIGMQDQKEGSPAKAAEDDPVRPEACVQPAEACGASCKHVVLLAANNDLQV